VTVTRPVLRYYGGKWKFAPWIISFFPPHRTYVEVFGGAGSVLLRKPRSRYEVYNDIDDEVVNLFRVLRDPEQATKLIEQINLTPLSRSEFDLAHEIVDIPIERARRTIIRSSMGYNAISVNENNTTGFRNSLRESGSLGAAWVSYPNNLKNVIGRLRGVVIENLSWEKIIPIYDRTNTLFYIDPPYLPSTRSDWKGKSIEGAYRYEMDQEEHVRLLEIIKTIQGMTVISGYRSTLYDEILSTWNSVEKDTKATSNCHDRTEVLWLSPNLQAARLPLLHLEAGQ
jgi:DNA adenine methylase